MTSAGVSGFRRRKAAPGLIGLLGIVIGLLTALLIANGFSVVRADSPTITLSTSTTNPGGEFLISGTGWAPAKHYTLYVYAQRLCNGQPTCPPPAGTHPVNTTPFVIGGDGTWTFDFTFSKNAGAITYVFTAVADYPADNPFTASVPMQVVPAGTPPSGTPISSAPAPSPTVAATNTPQSTATSSANQGGNSGTQANTPPPSSSGTSFLIVLVGLLLAALIVVLIVLLIVLPPKRRAIRAAFYGSQGESNSGYVAPGAAEAGRSRRATGGYAPPIEPELPWQGGVAQWDDAPRGSGPAARDRYTPRPPRRPTNRDY